MIFKPGKRRLKKIDDELRAHAAMLGAMPDMEKHFGTEVTITRECIADDWAKIVEDNGDWWWSLEWFEDKTKWGFGV